MGAADCSETLMLIFLQSVRLVVGHAAQKENQSVFPTASKNWRRNSV